MAWARKNQQVARLISVAIVIAVGVGIAVISRAPTSTPLDQAQTKLQKDEADLIGAALDKYYVEQGRYPVVINDVLSGDSNVSNAYNDLSEHDYRVSGDGKSYELTYRDKSGKTQIKHGDYEKDFH